MAVNKFATMIHRNTNKITLVLVYAVLEWTLILLLLLNSLFTLFILKFSHFFALKPPCLWCSTLHHILNPQNIDSHKDLLCEVHSKHVSFLGFCPNHKRLAEIKDFCEDCFSSHLDFQSELKQSDEEEHHIKCSCCGLMFHKKSVDDLTLTRISSDVLEYTKTEDSNDQMGSDLVKENLKVLMNFDGKDVWGSSTFEIENDGKQLERKENSISDFLPQHLEFFFDYSGSQLVPIELVDSTTEESQNISEADEECDFGDYQRAQVIQKHHKTELESMELEQTENFLVSHAKINEKSIIVEESRPLSIRTEELPVEIEDYKANTHLVHEEGDVAPGLENPVFDSCVEEPATISQDLHSCIKNAFKCNNLSGSYNEVEEEKTREGSSIEQKESTEKESYDGRVMSEMEAGDPINTLEELKSALKAERKALHALYSELEEERSAAAVAASETMAMINRLQEEKAAMQMEALQYQRMMEEQSEYDQEALQLLNELMTKREKELELYRKKVEDYEAKEQNEYGMLIETNDESLTGNQESWDASIPGDVVLELESSLADFEEERLSIFKQIKALEEKLFAISDDEDQRYADVRPVEDIDENVVDSVEKRLVHAMDAIDTEIVMESNRFDSENFENGLKRNDIEEVVDQVYGRLQALEADREFLKHCIGSLKKGDKGMGLLQEILQHLRDLRTMDLQR